MSLSMAVQMAGERAEGGATAGTWVQDVLLVAPRGNCEQKGNTGSVGGTTGVVSYRGTPPKRLSRPRG